MSRCDYQTDEEYLIEQCGLTPAEAAVSLREDELQAEIDAATREGAEGEQRRVTGLAQAFSRELLTEARKTTKPGSRAARELMAGIEAVEELIRRIVAAAPPPGEGAP